MEPNHKNVELYLILILFYLIFSRKINNFDDVRRETSSGHHVKFKSIGYYDIRLHIFSSQLARI